MILTTKARYAVMAVLEIWHGHQQNNKVINLSQIALAQNISLSYLEQIFSALKKSGIVSALKGPGGGYILAKSPQEITIANIVKAIGEPIKMTRCQTVNSGCLQNKSKCKTHHLWHGLEKQIYSYLDSITIQSL